MSYICFQRKMVIKNNFFLTEELVWNCAVLKMPVLYVSMTLIKILGHFSNIVKLAWAWWPVDSNCWENSILGLFWDRNVGLDILSCTLQDFCSTRDVFCDDLRESLLTGQTVVFRVLLLVIQDEFAFVLEVNSPESSNHIYQTFF